MCVGGGGGGGVKGERLLISCQNNWVSDSTNSYCSLGTVGREWGCEVMWELLQE